MYIGQPFLSLLVFINGYTHTEHGEALISKIVEKYLDIRLHYKLKKLSMPEKCIRQKFHKTNLFANERTLL